MNLLKALSESKLPITKEYRLDYIPANSEFVKMFMNNFSQGQNQFRFNLSCNIKLESCDYIEALKQAASRTANVFLVNHSNFSVKDFCDLVIAANNVQKVCIENCKIPMDSEFEFGEQLTSCSIQHLSLKYSGHINHSNWEANPHRFENLLKAISKCEPLKNSLKTLDLELCGISKKKADEYRIQYGLNELKLKGFSPF